MLGPNGYIVHTGLTGDMRFGFYEDQESNGNSDDCAFNTYDHDELFNDGDAGLLFPSPFSMGPPEYPAGPFGSDHELGTGCSSVHWGTEIDIHYVNNTLHEAYINVIFDFDGNGEWGGQFTCFPGPLLVIEHAVRNVKVSATNNGNLSSVLNALGQAYTAVGGERFVWARFTISEFPVPPDWDGAGIFGDGETEDYLFKIGAPLPAPNGPVTATATVPLTWEPDQSIVINSGPCAAELGDAPDGIRAYSDVSGLPRDGLFPTRRNGIHGSIVHAANASDENCFFGFEADYEMDATGTCAGGGHETDESSPVDDCDPGIHGPLTYTIDASGLEVPTAFYPGSEPFFGTGSSTVSWGQGPGQFDLYVQNTRGSIAFVNAVIDFDRDGDWDVFTAPQVRGGLDPASPDAGELMATNRAATNIVVPANYVGWLSGLAPPPLNLAGQGGYAWARFSITSVPISPSWNGSGNFPFGESEDYLFRLNPTASSGVTGPATTAGLQLAQNLPNPMTASTQIGYRLDQAGEARVDLFDVSGRLVRRLEAGTFEAGDRTVTWDGRDASGGIAPPGIYLYRLSVNGRSLSRKLILSGG
ncbi:MAG TPA: FlgD immunoglobulin-like domain containing protein, partial [Candidatus Eisenbacteria bacterium]